MRLKSLLGMPEGYTDPVKVAKLQRSKYGLGDRRTLDQAITFSGVDTKHLVILGNRCGNLEYVPFVEHPKGPDYIPQFDPVTEEPLDVPDEGSIFHGKYLLVSNASDRQTVIEQQNKAELKSENRVVEKAERKADVEPENKVEEEAEKNAVELASPSEKEEASSENSIAGYKASSSTEADSMSLLEKEYHLLLRLEQKAESALGKVGLSNEPAITTRTAFLCCVVFTCGVFLVIFGHRLHVGKNHRNAAWYDPVKTV